MHCKKIIMEIICQVLFLEQAWVDGVIYHMESCIAGYHSPNKAGS